MNVRPWQIWWAKLDPTVGHEQSGVRPVIIVSTPMACRISNGLVTVVPCTSTNRSLPFQPQVSIGDQISYAMTEQVKTISDVRLLNRVDTALPGEQITTIKFALRQMVNC